MSRKECGLLMPDGQCFALTETKCDKCAFYNAHIILKTHIFEYLVKENDYGRGYKAFHQIREIMGVQNTLTICKTLSWMVYKKQNGIQNKEKRKK